MGKGRILHADLRRELRRAYSAPLKFIQDHLPPLRRNPNMASPVHFQQLVGYRFFLHPSIMTGFPRLE